ncbi:hypothetical protein O181_066114, partial [Austropuccinia psidii MF-1]|nr:hypothetical protein [Austropuccinia psidii MF-1]
MCIYLNPVLRGERIFIPPMWKGLMFLPPNFRIKRKPSLLKREIPILLFNSYEVQLSKRAILMGNNQISRALYLQSESPNTIIIHFKVRVENNFIPLESQSQANTPVTPSEPEGIKGKGKRQSEGLITTKKWTPIATQKSRKSQNSASIQGKPTLITCTGKITIINPVVTSKGKFPKSADNKFVQGTVK